MVHNSKVVVTIRLPSPIVETINVILVKMVEKGYFRSYEEAMRRLIAEAIHLWFEERVRSAMKWLFG